MVGGHVPPLDCEFFLNEKPNSTCTMNPHTSQYSLIWVLVVSLAGCNEQAVRYPVAGRVVIDGQPVPMGTIQFVPAQGRPVASKIGRDGSFRLVDASVDSDSTKSGVVAGRYQIGVSSAEIVNEDQDEMLRHIPEKYADYRTSELEVEIDSPQPDMLIELTWEGAEEYQEEETSEEVDEAAERPEASDATTADQEASNEE